MNGVINFFKPKGMTSHDAVNLLRKALNMKRIGHTGTLDPNASGVLPLCIGKGTRIAEYLLDIDKEFSPIPYPLLRFITINRFTYQKAKLHTVKRFEFSGFRVQFT